MGLYAQLLMSLRLEAAQARDRVMIQAGNTAMLRLPNDLVVAPINAVQAPPAFSPVA